MDHSPQRAGIQGRAVPTATGSGVKVYAAKNEFEPFQLVVKPAASGNVGGQPGRLRRRHHLRNLPGQVRQHHPGQRQPGKHRPLPRSTVAAANGATVRGAGENTAFWFSLSVPATTAAGDYTANVHRRGRHSHPAARLQLRHPRQLHVQSQMNYSHETILTNTASPAPAPSIGCTWKDQAILHRPPTDAALVLWSGGLTTGGACEPYIGYDCNPHLHRHRRHLGLRRPGRALSRGHRLMNGKFTTPFNGGTGFSSFRPPGFATTIPRPTSGPPASADRRAAAATGTLQNPTSAYNQAWFRTWPPCRTTCSVGLSGQGLLLHCQRAAGSGRLQRRGLVLAIQLKAPRPISS